MLSNESVRVALITIYPVKSLDGIDVPNAQVQSSGALQYDRRWAMIDGQGNFVNAKRTPRIHDLAAEFDLARDRITVGRRGQPVAGTFSLIHQVEELNRWLSGFFGFEIRLVENTDVGHPDDLQAPGPTVLSTETLHAVASWFDQELAPARRRFRANIELATPAAFWEDRLFGPADQVIRFRIGQVLFEGSNPCARCVVPSRDPDTGEVIPKFAAEFARRREETVPLGAARARFDHFYRLSVNSRLASAGGRISVGDEVEVF